MLDGHQISLRDRLRHDTSDDHDRLDALFGTLDLTSAAGITRFFAAHRAGFAAMRDVFPGDGGFVAFFEVDEMVAALDADLRTLKGKAPSLSLEPVGHQAFDHIILGSRLGTAVLRRTWQTATDDRVRAASRYFSLAGKKLSWQAHTARLHVQSSDGHTADRVIDETRTLYTLFERAYHATE